MHSENTLSRPQGKRSYRSYFFYRMEHIEYGNQTIHFRKWVESSLSVPNWVFQFDHAVSFNFVNSFDLQSGNLHHISYIYHGPGYCSKTEAIGTQCKACGKQFVTSCAFDQHRRSGYLIGTGCHVLDDGLTRSLLVSTSRANMSTAMLQKLKMKPKHRGMIAEVKLTLRLGMLSNRL